MHIITINLDKLLNELSSERKQIFELRNIITEDNYIHNPTIALQQYADFIKVQSPAIIYNALKNTKVNYCYFYSYIKAYLRGKTNWESMENIRWIDKAYFTIPYCMLNNKNDLHIEREYKFYIEYGNIMGVVKNLENEGIKCIYLEEDTLPKFKY